MERPYAMGHHGHARCCDCIRCAETRAMMKLAEWQKYGGVAEADPEKTVFVRAYWRKQPGHLRNYPQTLKRLQRLLKTLQRGQKQSARVRRAA